MRMEKKNVFEFKSAIEISPDDLKDFENLICKYYNQLNYRVLLKNGNSITFDDLNELLVYDNDAKDKIIKLNITGGKYDFSSDIDVTFVAGSPYYTAFSSSVKVEYKVSDPEKEILFLEDMKKFFRHLRAEPWYLFFSKISSFHINALVAIYFVYYFFCNYSVLGEQSPIAESSIMSIILGIFFIAVYAFLYWLIYNLFNVFWRFLFPPVVFLWGGEIRHIKNISKYRKFIFSGCIFTIIIAIVSEFFIKNLNI